MSTGVVALIALLAACCFAVSAVLQQAAAGSVPESDSLRPGLLLDLVRRPVWLAGIAMSALSYGVQGVALAFGPLVLVQPLAATDLVFALPLIAWRRRARIGRLEATGALCTVAGVAAFLVVLPPPTEAALPSTLDWVPLVAVAGSLVAGLATAGVRSAGRARTGLYAAAAGVSFALLDSLTKSAAGLARSEGAGVLVHWEPYAVLAVGGLGLLLAQSSFQAGSLALSLPVIDTLEPIGSVLVGAAVFHERLAAATWEFTVQLLGAAAAVAGIVMLDRSPLVRD